MLHIYDTKTKLKREYYRGLFTGIGLSCACFLIFMGLVGFQLNDIKSYLIAQQELQNSIESVLR